MKFRKSRWLKVGGTIVAIVLAAGCTTKTRHEWASTFFDGVPQEGEVSKPRHRLKYAEGTHAYNTNSINRIIAKAVTPMVLHPPYRDRHCDACHESEFSNKIRGPLLEVCFVCHQNFLEKVKYRHAPAESGACLVCHNPHQTFEKRLLKRKGQQVCFECHDKADVTKTAAHAQIGETACFVCHNPHGGDNGKFVKSQAEIAAALKAAAEQPAADKPAPVANRPETPKP